MGAVLLRPRAPPTFRHHGTPARATLVVLRARAGPRIFSLDRLALAGAAPCLAAELAPPPRTRRNRFPPRVGGLRPPVFQRLAVEARALHPAGRAAAGDPGRRRPRRAGRDRSPGRHPADLRRLRRRPRPGTAVPRPPTRTSREARARRAAAHLRRDPLRPAARGRGGNVVPPPPAAHSLGPAPDAPHHRRLRRDARARRARPSPLVDPRPRAYRPAGGHHRRPRRALPRIFPRLHLLRPTSCRRGQRRRRTRARPRPGRGPQRTLPRRSGIRAALARTGPALRRGPPGSRRGVALAPRRRRLRPRPLARPRALHQPPRAVTAPALPFLPLTRPTLDEETIAGVADVLRSGWITSGPQVKAFEARLSERFGGRPVRAFNSGTATLEVALRLAGVGPGHDVITTPLSWVATSNVILAVGANPVFVDIDPATRNLDLDRIPAALTARTRALLPVDLAGLPVDRDRLYGLARRHGLRVIEDAAQSLGSSWRGVPVGSVGDLVSFSFHPNKNATAIEGGALVLNTDAEARLAEQYRLQGVVRSGFDGMEVEVLGGKFNLTDVAARVGLGQLARLDAFNARRRELARRYFDCLDRADLAALGLGLPVAEFTQGNWHMFQVLLPGDRLNASRAAIMQELHAAGIGTGVHYPPIHLFKLYRARGWRPGDFPHAERAGRDLLTLPLFPAMTDADVERVAATLATVLLAHRR
ncbi:MAG: DegT/DnrJ/EryC1/StrS family aminotransferase [Candidatus Didemnitutus sp.]|nr:DegT/DnrJ/EryC1/StrS family aminotransferase [Candidatus Didemnitutus sp.]